MSRLLVVVVTYNGMRWLERCLDSVLSSDVKADLFVVDNGSDDGSAEFVASRYPSAKLVRSEVNLGFAKANNLGFKHALDNGYDYIYLLNQDAWVRPDTFRKLVEAIERGFNGLLSPLQMRPDLVEPDKRFRRHYHGPMEASDTVYPARFVMAAHWMLPAELVRTVGFFSPAFTHFGEDNNYCERVRYHGFKVGVLPSAVAVHDRQTRKMAKETRVRRNCQYSRSRLSDPGSSFAVQAVSQPLRQCLMALRWLSFQPLKDIPSLLREYPSLKRWRKDSMAKGAFMNIDNQ